MILVTHASLLLILIVTVNGVHVSPSGTITALNGTQVSITCSLGEGSHDVRSIRWSGPAIGGDNVQIEYDVFEAGSTLHINNIDESDEGRYTCLYNHTFVSVTVIVNQFESSYFENIVETQNFVEGSDARILCHAFLGEPAGQMLWYHNGSLINISSVSRYVFHEEELNQALEIKNIQISDSGVYCCTIFSTVTFGTLYMNITVNILPRSAGAPNIDKSIRTHTFWYLDDLELTCNVISGDEPITYTWSIDGIAQRDNMSTLHRENNTYEGGEYRCTARNTLGVDSFTIIVKVNAPPLPPHLTLVFDAVFVDGDTAILRYERPTTPIDITLLHFEWSKLVNDSDEAVPVQLGSRITKSFQGFLTIEDIQYSDSGTYLVNISNEFGASVQMVQLYVYPITIYNIPIYNATESGSTLHATTLIVRCNPEDGGVRLIGGSSDHEGRVEICNHNISPNWVTVCNYFWDEFNARVACRHAGFAYEGAKPVTRPLFGYASSGQSLLLVCNGSELRLTDCNIVDPGDRPCMDAGVRCPNLIPESMNAIVTGPVEFSNTPRIYITIAIVPVLVVIIIVVLFIILAVIFRKKRLLIQRPHQCSQEHIYDTLDEIVPPPLPPVRTQHVRTEQNLSYESAAFAPHCINGIFLLNNNDSESDSEIDPPLSIIEESQAVDNIPECHEDSQKHNDRYHPEYNNPKLNDSEQISTTNKSPSIKQVGNDNSMGDERHKHGVENESDLQENILPQVQSLDHDQTQTHQNCAGYEAIGGYDRAPCIDNDHLPQLPSDRVHQHCCNNVEIVGCQSSTGIHDDSGEGCEAVSQVQDSNDYDQIQGYELIGGYEKIGGYERAPPIDIDHLPLCLSDSVPPNEHYDEVEVTDLEYQNTDENCDEDVNQDYFDQIQVYDSTGGYEAIGGYERAPPIDHLSQCLSLTVPHNEHCNDDSFEVTDCQSTIAIHNNIDERSAVVNQAQDSNDYDQIQDYELIGGYEKIGGYERAPNIDIDHLSQFFSNQEQRQDSYNNADDVDITESQNSRSESDNDISDQPCENDYQDYDQIQSYKLAPQLQDTDIANIIAEFGSHNQSESNLCVHNHNGGTDESLELEELVEQDDIETQTADVSCDQN